ncbi:pfkB family carbohydrate kinase [Klebsiella pneumoniae]|nr:pfkB family carbohydrate kinase [Klebsiella pneumoniae]
MATFDAVFVGLTILDIAGRPVVAIPPRGGVAFIEQIRLNPAGTAAGLISTPRSSDPHRSGGLPGRR